MDPQSLLSAPATWVISIFNVIWFLYVTMHGDTRNPDTLVRFGATERYRIWNEGESWRLVTSCFLHIGWIHLLWNTYMMFGWCSHVEEKLGSVRFVMTYLMSGIGASAVWGLFWSDPYVYSILRMTIIWILIGIFLIRVDNFAHIGGLIFGLLAGYALGIDSEDPLRIPFLVGVLALWIGVVWMSLHPRFARRDRNDFL